jgi:murein DD-endopeptidase MepM/ murein hydrolase activator NlpD
MVVALAIGAAACDSSTTPPRVATSAQPTANAASGTALEPVRSSPPGSQPASRVATLDAQVRYVFPVVGNASYARTHHDYPAADIFAKCGAKVVSPVNGTVLEVTRVDTYKPKVNSGETRGGLSVSILGQDGARYYGSHFSSVTPGIEPGVTLTAGQRIAAVGSTGRSGACHVHFGLSPACARTGDWWTRRGVIWPWPYLDAWRAGTAKSPMSELASWQATNGCPTKPQVDP